MAPQVPWPYVAPPRIVVDPDWSLAAGEESGERHTMAERCDRLPPVSYPTPSHVPPWPADPLHAEPEPDYRYADEGRV